MIITDNTINSTIDIIGDSYPIPIIIRFSYVGGVLKISNEYSFSNLDTTLGYSLNNTKELNFNWNIYNEVDSITISNSNSQESITLNSVTTSGFITFDNNLTLSCNREEGLPLIFKNREGTIISSSFFSGSLTINAISSNVVTTNTGIEIDYSDEITEEREHLQGFINEVDENEFVPPLTILGNQGVVLSPQFEVDYMKIIFYKSTAEQNRVYKIPYLTEYFSCEGELKEGTSITNPSILIDFAYGEHQEIFSCNYAYIPLFNRYYFITDITSIYTNLYQIVMKVDVLNTYRNQINNLSGIIRRNEFTFNPDLIDEKMIQEIDYNIDITEYENDLFNDEYYQECPSFVIMLSGRGNN